MTTPDWGTPPTLACPLCRGTTFQQEESRQDSRWGFTTHRMTLLVCDNCRYVLHFYDQNSIFDFG
jgi:uncharacterized protein YbaR (Trm112 family)